MQSLPAQGVSVVIAVYNEIDNIEPLLSEILQTLDKLDRFEVIIVDDASKDGTAQRLTQLCQQYHRLRPVYHSRNYGQSIAVISGVRAARYDWVVTIDGDGQNDPADIPKLFAGRCQSECQLPDSGGGYSRAKE